MFTLKYKFLSLKNLGIAVEYFPGYTNRKVNLHSLDVVLLSFILRGTGRHLIEIRVSGSAANGLRTVNPRHVKPS